jgi:serine/threonine protein kinase
MSVRPPMQQTTMGHVTADGAPGGAYRVVRRIASGSLSTVHLVEGSTERGMERFAVKRLLPRLAGDPARVAAFRRHAELGMRGLPQHIAVVTSAADRAVPQIAMPYIEGTDLQTLVDRSRALGIDPRPYALPLFVEALKSLQALHDGQWDTSNACPLVHQAPTARHILVHADATTRLTDLALAMGPTVPRLEVCDELLRPAEMAPEQSYAPDFLDGRCDLFIVGIALWELMTGARLFQAATRDESLNRMLRAAIAVPSEAGAGTKALDRVCKRALERTRGERYPIALEMAHELSSAAAKAGLFARQEQVIGWVSDLVEREIPGSDSGARAPEGRRALRSTLLGYGPPSDGGDGPSANRAQSSRPPPYPSHGRSVPPSLAFATEPSAPRVLQAYIRSDAHELEQSPQRSRNASWLRPQYVFLAACLLAATLFVARARRSIERESTRISANVGLRPPGDTLDAADRAEAPPSGASEILTRDPEPTIPSMPEPALTADAPPAEAPEDPSAGALLPAVDPPPSPPASPTSPGAVHDKPVEPTLASRAPRVRSSRTPTPAPSPAWSGGGPLFSPAPAARTQEALPENPY